ncbi:MAG: GMC family oxidoreductase, partial [Pseudomonadota bacterium]
MNDHFDIAVIGAGASGALAAELLATRGYNVIVLDAGPGLEDQLRSIGGDKSHKPNSYIYNEFSAPLIADDVRQHIESTHEKFHWSHVQGLGGRSLFWQGVALRMSDKEFKAASHDGCGIDWPIGQADLDDYYRLCEKRFGIAGKADPSKDIVIGKLRDRLGLNAFACPYTAKYFRQPKAGYRAWIEDSIADGVFYPPKEGLTIRSMAVVNNLNLAPKERQVESVGFFDRRTGRREHITARVVFVCASTLETTRILLGSRDALGVGLRESTHGLGCNLMTHLKGISLSTKQTSRQYLRQPEELVYCPFQASFHNNSKLKRGWGLQIRVKDNSGGIRVNAFGEDLPYLNNCVELDESQLDEWGRPKLRISFTWGENELLMRDAQVSQMERLADKLELDGAAITHKLNAPGKNNHELGTARMGSSPKNSVLDRYNRIWGYDNVYVVDGSAFTSSGYQNPTLTILALTWRACD